MSNKKVIYFNYTFSFLVAFILFRKLLPDYSQMYVALEFLFLLVGVCLYYFNGGKKIELDKKVAVFFILYCVLGVFSALSNTGLSQYLLIQTVLNCKVILVLLYVLMFYDDAVFSRFMNFILYTTTVFLIFEVLAPNQYYTIFPGTSESSTIPGTNINRLSGFFIHPGQLAFFCISFIFYQIIRKIKSGGSFGKGMYLAIFFLILTGQRVEILMLPGALLVNWFLGYKRSLVVASYPIIIIIVACLLVALAPVILESFSSFFVDDGDLSETAPRRVIFQESLFIASTYFPLGSGFATFGSAQSILNPNSAYDLTYLTGLWWYENGMFLFDFFWGSVIAEAGYLGLGFYLFFILTMLLHFYKGVAEVRGAFEIKVLYLYFSLYFLINSIGTPFLNGSLLMLLFFFCLLMSFSSVEGSNDECY